MQLPRKISDQDTEGCSAKFDAETLRGCKDAAIKSYFAQSRGIAEKTTK
jgi:hypothetical protein